MADALVTPALLEGQTYFDDYFDFVDILTLLPDSIITGSEIPVPVVLQSGVVSPALIQLTSTVGPGYVATSEPVAPSLITLTTQIPTPVIFSIIGDAEVQPNLLASFSVIDIPEISRTVEEFVLSGDGNGFALIPRCTISVERPETVDRIIRPLRTTFVDTDEYRLFNGRPIPVPKFDVRFNLEVNNVGHYITDREDQYGIDTEADLRWVADANHYDETYYKWVPIDDGLATQYWWESTEEWAPTYNQNFRYVVDSEEFNFPSIHFDEEERQHMWTDWGNNNSTSESLTIMMVCFLAPPNRFQDYYSVIDNGSEPPNIGDFNEPFSGNRVQASIYPHKAKITFDTETVRTSNEKRPSFNKVGILTMQWKKAGFYMQWVSQEEKFSRFTTPEGVVENNIKPIYHELVLGRKNGSVFNSEANMDIFEMNVWTNDPAKDVLRATRSKLRSVYGIIR